MAKLRQTGASSLLGGETLIVKADTANIIPSLNTSITNMSKKKKKIQTVKQTTFKNFPQHQLPKVNMAALQFAISISFNWA